MGTGAFYKPIATTVKTKFMKVLFKHLCMGMSAFK